jgi:antitoxin VapB
MAILIKNRETERKARELATLKGQTITGAIDAAVEQALAAERPAHRRPTLDEMIAATDEFRRKTGLDKRQLVVTKADWDEINEVPGLDDE